MGLHRAQLLPKQYQGSLHLIPGGACNNSRISSQQNAAVKERSLHLPSFLPVSHLSPCTRDAPLALCHIVQVSGCDTAVVGWWHHAGRSLLELLSKALITALTGTILPSPHWG